MARLRCASSRSRRPARFTASRRTRCGRRSAGSWTARLRRRAHCSRRRTWCSSGSGRTSGRRRCGCSLGPRWSRCTSTRSRCTSTRSSRSPCCSTGGCCRGCSRRARPASPSRVASALPASPPPTRPSAAPPREAPTSAASRFAASAPRSLRSSSPPAPPASPSGRPPTRCARRSSRSRWRPSLAASPPRGAPLASRGGS